MKLTDELRAQMVSALKQSFPRMTAAGWEPELTERECVIAAAAYRAGAEDMRERAAKACERERVDAHLTREESDYAYNHATEHCAADIRALGVDDE